MLLLLVTFVVLLLDGHDDVSFLTSFINFLKHSTFQAFELFYPIVDER
jgi:hypothetical protein